MAKSRQWPESAMWLSLRNESGDVVLARMAWRMELHLEDIRQSIVSPEQLLEQPEGCMLGC